MFACLGLQGVALGRNGDVEIERDLGHLALIETPVKAAAANRVTSNDARVDPHQGRRTDRLAKLSFGFCNSGMAYGRHLEVQDKRT